MMVTMFATGGDKFAVKASTVNGKKPGVCLSIDDSRKGELDLHLDTPGELIAFGKSIVKEGLRLALEADEKASVADPSYTPTVEEAARNPAEFVAGMTETRQLNHGIPDFRGKPLPK